MTNYQKIYRCTLCAWEYIESKEADFANLPLNWACPDCGGMKRDFEEAGDRAERFP